MQHAPDVLVQYAQATCGLDADKVSCMHAHTFVHTCMPLMHTLPHMHTLTGAHSLMHTCIADSNARTYVCMYVCMYVYVHGCTYKCTFLYIVTNLRLNVHTDVLYEE